MHTHADKGKRNGTETERARERVFTYQRVTYHISHYNRAAAAVFSDRIIRERVLLSNMWTLGILDFCVFTYSVTV